MTRGKIRIVEVGPRDGLQNEKRIFTTLERTQLINDLSLCGFDEIEVGSFVSPKWVPQMANTRAVYEAIVKNPNTHYSVLVPNMQGFVEALAAKVRSISIFTAASEAFNQKNINCTIAESFERFIPLMVEAKKYGIRVRGYVSCVISCPYSGDVDPEQVQKVAGKLWEIGCDEISLGDTIGRGTPASILPMLHAVVKAVPLSVLAIHCHDTYGKALDNMAAAVDFGVQTVDAAMNGLGGCPYGGENAKGNVATQQVVACLKNLGYQTSINADALKTASEKLIKVMTKNEKQR